MVSAFLTDFISSCQDVADCRIVSKDGKEFWAHKIILGARSEFFRDILANISDAGHATIILPDHADQEVDNIRTEIISLGKELTEEELYGLLFIRIEDQKSPEKTVLDGNNHNTKLKNNDENCVPEDILESSEIKIESNANNDEKNRAFKIDPECNLEDKNKGENILETKQSLYKEAVDSYFAGDFSSLYQVSKYYNLPYSTLYSVLVSRGSYKGKGRKGSLFTTEEEKEITNDIVSEVNNGRELTWKVLNEIIEKQMEILMTSNPTRDTFKVSATKGSIIDRYFVRRFARRNNLMQYIAKKNSDFDCKECSKSFSFKNALVKHEKTLHR